MNFLTQAIPNDPQTAVALRLPRAFVPAIVIKPVFSGSLVIKDVRVLTRNGSIDFVIFDEREIVAPRGPVQPRDLDGSADIGALLLERQLRLAGGSADNNQLGRPSARAGGSAAGAMASVST